MVLTTQEQGLATVRGYIEAINTRDIDKLMSFVDESYVHHYLPSTLNLPDKTMAEIESYWRTSILPMFKWWKLKEVLTFAAEDKITMLASSTGMSTSDRPYGQEYSLTFRVSPDGKKLVEVWEFVDSLYSMTWFPEERIRQKKMADGEPLED